ncbi:AbrB family transcriptional regulator [Peribacillus sp. SCS-155]|uniref:AbrB family transcriptional regulator n=1 Tax=Peribacillus sedimenti TaxID=3115297 RepID=UPI003906B954
MNVRFRKNNLKALCITGGSAAVGGSIFYISGMYLPWLLGPLLAVMVLKWKFPNYLHWPGKLRNAGLIVLGLQLGSSFTREAVGQMIANLPIMLITTVLIILFTALTAIFLSKRVGLTLNTALLGSFPGGLSQMVILSEEIKNADEGIVAFMQTLRILLVISIVPWLVVHVLTEHASNPVQTIIKKGHFFIIEYDWRMAALLGVMLFIAIFAGRKLHFPLPFMLCPLLTAAVFNLSGWGAPSIPGFWLNTAQLLIGAHLGATLRANNPGLFKKLFGVILIGNILLIGFCYGVASILVRFLSFPINDLFLSLAPGGVAEMAVTAMSVNADVSIVTGFHLFRIFFILFLLSPVIKWLAVKSFSKSGL